MSYYGAKELVAAFKTVRKNTVHIAEEIPENKYDFRPAPDTRTVGQTLVHIALSPGFQLHVHQGRIDDLKKVNFPELMQKFMAEEAKPRTKAEIITLLTTEGDRFSSFVESQPDSFFIERVAMQPGAELPSKSRFEMLLSPKEHEMHHRGQLMTMQRMMGTVPHLTRLMMERMAQAQAAAGQQAR
jgi:uncharacterized damage-inducible protein DinB